MSSMKLDKIKWNLDSKNVTLNFDINMHITKESHDETTQISLNPDIDFKLNWVGSRYLIPRITTRNNTYHYHCNTSILFMNKNPDAKYVFILKSSAFSKVSNNTIFIHETDIWRCILHGEKEDNSMNLSVTFDTVPCVSLTTLHSDTELTDFELRGEDGSVPIHRVVLAAASPAFKNMLIGTWREAKEGRVELPVSTETLRHFKDYIYLGTLPQTGLLELASFAKYCMMPELECQCIQKLGHILTVKSNKKEEEQKSE